MEDFILEEALEFLKPKLEDKEFELVLSLFKRVCNLEFLVEEIILHFPKSDRKAFRKPGESPFFGSSDIRPEKNDYEEARKRMNSIAESLRTRETKGKQNGMD